MISKVTESNVNLIKARIAEINEALAAKGSSTVLQPNLESYFANIREISELQTNFHESKYKFFLMPLDEPMFEIDADKRTIAVPQHFNKNGVAVRGDHKAEILYFRVDQYYDYQNLFNVDQIIINWQFRPSNASRNTDAPVNTSIALAPDETFDPGHIVFGWVITDEMTPSKGQLTFSVSFVNHTGTQYDYVLSTMTASVNVNDSLVLEDPSILDSMAGPVFDRLSDSRYTPDSIVPLVDPQFRSGDERDDGTMTGLPSFINFDIENDEEADTLLLQAVGYTTDDGQIKYTWYGTPQDGSEPVSRADSETVASDYVLTQDLEPMNGVEYYIFKEGLPTKLSATSDPTLEEAFADINVDVFELGSSFEVDKAGFYQVTMQSEKEITQSGSDLVVAKSGNINSISCLIPTAAVPAVELSAESTVRPRIYEGGEEEAAQYVFIDAASPTIKADVSVDETAYDITKGITENSSIGALGFKLVAEGAEAPSDEEIAALSYKYYDEGEDIYVERPLLVSAEKLMVAPNDGNVVESQENQDAIRIVQVNGHVLVVGELDGLNSFASTNPSQGSAKWVAIDLATNLPSIVGAYWGEYELAEADVEEAASVGLGAGHIIFWAKAEDIASSARAIAISADGYDTANLSVEFVEADALAARLAQLADEPAFEEGTYMVYAVNKRNHTYSVSAPSNVIRVSKAAPALKEIDVDVTENTGFDLRLIENNVSTESNPEKLKTIALDYNHDSRSFKINIDDILSENVERFVRVIEIPQKGEDVRSVDIDADGFVIAAEGEPEIVVQANNTFSISNPGWFVVQVETRYHGTYRVTVTEPFAVVASN